MRELADKRTRFSKTFELSDGRCRLEAGQQPCHFVRNGQFVDIDLTHHVDAARDQFVFQNCPYSLRIDRNAPAYAYNALDGKRVSIELITQARGCLAEGGLYKWGNVGRDTDYVIQPLPAGCTTLLILAGPDAPREWSWRVDGDTDLIVPLVGNDSAGRRLELVETRDQTTGTISVRWTGRTLSGRALRRERRAAWSEDVTWPVVIDPTINENIVANGDDASSYWSNNGATFYAFTANSVSIAAGRIGTNHFYAGLRFQTIAIANTATIDAATLTIRTLALTGTPNTNIFGNDVDDASIWANPGNRIKNITKTTAVVNKADWVAASDNDVTVTSIVAEIIARAGWASNNDLAFGFFNNVGSGSHAVLFASLNHATLTEPRLAITFSAAGAAAGRRVGRGLTQSVHLKRRQLVN